GVIRQVLSVDLNEHTGSGSSRRSRREIGARGRGHDVAGVRGRGSEADRVESQVRLFRTQIDGGSARAGKNGGNIRIAAIGINGGYQGLRNGIEGVAALHRVGVGFALNGDSDRVFGRNGSDKRKRDDSFLPHRFAGAVHDRFVRRHKRRITRSKDQNAAVIGIAYVEI